MVRPSGLADVSQEALLEGLTEVAARSSVPIIVQDAPQSTGVHLAPATLARLVLEAPNVIGLKVEPIDSARKMSLVGEHLRGAKTTIIGGGGGVDYVHELERGALGTMPGPAYPELFAAIGALHLKADRGKAFELLSRALQLMELGKRGSRHLPVHSEVRFVKTGRAVGSTRLGQPHRDIDPRLQSEVDELLDTLVLLDLFEECGKPGELTDAAE